MRTYQLRRIYDFRGGLNRKDSPVQLKENESPYILNAVFTDRGAIKKRPGYAEYNSTAITGANHIEFLKRFYRTDGSAAEDILAIDHDTNNKLYKTAGSGNFTQITQASTNFGANKYMSAVDYQNYLFITDATGDIQAYPKTALTTDDIVHTHGGIALPKGKHLAICDDRLFVAGDPNNKDRLYFSEIGLFSTDPFTDCDFSADGVVLNFIDIPARSAKGGSGITGLILYKDELVVFREGDAWVLLGVDEDDYYLQRIENANGAIDLNNIFDTGRGLVWVSPNFEILLWTGGGDPENIGLKAWDYLKDEDFSACAAAHFPKLNILLFSFKKDAAYNDYTLVYDLDSRSWCGLWDIGFSCFAVRNNTDDSGEIYAGDSNTGKIHQLDTGTNDNGGNIEFTYYSPHLTLGMPEIDKIWRRVYFDINAQDETPFDVTIALDFDRRRQVIAAADLDVSGFNVWDQFIWEIDIWGGGALQKAIATLQGGMRAKTCQVRVSVTDKQDLTIYGFSPQYKPRRIRGVTSE